MIDLDTSHVLPGARLHYVYYDHSMHQFVRHDVTGVDPFGMLLTTPASFEEGVEQATNGDRVLAAGVSPLQDDPESL